MKLRRLQDLDLENKTVLIRVDYNVPITKNGEISDSARIQESLPTLRELLQHNCKIVILSHLGRPDGQNKPEFSLNKVSGELARLLARPVIFIDDCLKPGLQDLIASNPAQSIFLLENLRFYAEEEKNDLEFAKKLAELGQVYISDAFGAVHRKHASIDALAQLLPSAAGLLLQKEITALSSVLTNAQKPFTLIVGGAKVETKVGVLKNFSPQTTKILIGGGLANTFLAAQEKKIGQSYFQNEYLQTAKQLLESDSDKIVLPIDYICTKGNLSNSSAAITKSPDNIDVDDKIVDIGPNSAAAFVKIILDSKTIVWNGPVGVFELTPFRSGTTEIVEAIVTAGQKGATTIVGGGDSLDVIKTLGVDNSKFTHVSTGGGAMLEFLEGKTLPGIEVLS